MAGLTKDHPRYEKHRQEARERRAKISRLGRDIGTTPDIVDLTRRQSCKMSLKKFCETYNPEAFTLDFATIHEEMFRRMEEAVVHGALFVFACPRGSGKSTIARMCALWALSYSHCKYVFLVGANAGKAEDSLGAIKTWMRFLDDWGDDFPEISTGVRAVNGVAARANGQLHNGHPTMIEWTKDSVVLPTVDPPANLPGKFETSPSSGSCIAVSGLTGDGIRGSLKTCVDGSQIRPDFVLLDDPQTDDSAASPRQNQTREKLISGAVLGMAGPGKKISAVMPCTVIAQGDMVDSLLDREKHPLWRGIRTKMLESMPDDMPLWNEYFEIYKECMLLEPPDIKTANQFYKKNRKKMDKGAHATWLERYNPDEVSAIQSAMNLYCRDPVMFASEYQNAPLISDNETEFLKAPEIAVKQHALERGKVPLQVETIKCFIDVQKDMYFYSIWGFSDRFDGFLIDYGTLPKQSTGYYSKRTAKRLDMTMKSMGLEARLHQSLTEFIDMFSKLEFKRDGDNAKMKISRIGVDAGYKTSTVRRVWRDSPHRSIVTLCMGAAYGAKKRPLAFRPVKSGDKKGSHWFMKAADRSGNRTLEVDTNFWKTFVCQRLATSIGDAGSFSLFKVKTPSMHRLIAEHFTSEFRTLVEAGYGRIDEWSVLPGRPDNDFFDCMVGCAALASFDGVTTIGVEVVEQKGSRKRLKPSAWGKVRK